MYVGVAGLTGNVGQITQTCVGLCGVGVARSCCLGCPYGGIGVATRSTNAAGFAKSGAINSAASPAVCNVTEIATARRLIFLSRSVVSASPSTRHPVNVPARASAFTRSSLDMTHLHRDLGACISSPPTKQIAFAYPCENPTSVAILPRRLPQGSVLVRTSPCLTVDRRGARRDVRCARPHVLGHRSP